MMIAISRQRLLIDGIAAGSVLLVAGRSSSATLSSPKSCATVSIENFSAAGVSQGAEDEAKVVKADAEWRSQLSALAYQVTRHAATERAFSREYDRNHADALYRCICCDTALLDSRTKFD